MNSSSSHLWTLGIKDNFGKWKVINPWDWGLQLREQTNAGERNILFSWDRSIMTHKFMINISPNANTKFEIYEDNKLLSSWLTNSEFNISALWLGILGNGDYEFANFKLCDDAGCSEEPSQTPTPTISSPTPSPTPTTSPPKDVFIIPGMGGSWNKEAFLKCKLDGFSGQWVPWLINGKSPYEVLSNSLTSAGYIPHTFYYDWRKSVFTLSPILNSFIASNRVNKTVAIIGHSYGGLVGRKYLEDTKEFSSISDMVTVGTPHQGAVLAYPAWAGGDVQMQDIQIRLASTILEIGCFLEHKWTPQQTYSHLMPSIQNVLPTFNYLTDQSGSEIPAAGMLIKNSYLPTTFTSPIFNTRIGTINGSGYKTLLRLSVRPQSKLEQKLGIWRDGKPTGSVYSDEGDGTVLLRSAEVPNAEGIVLSLDHLSLITHPSGIRAILGFLDRNNPEFLLQKLLQAEKDKQSHSVEALFIVSDDADLTLTDQEGQIYTADNGQITLYYPKSGIYSLTLKRQHKLLKPHYSILVIQLFEDGSKKWKKYDRYDLFPKKFKLKIHQKYRTDDILDEE